MPRFTYVTATSEANSYGITQDRWFDGKSETGSVDRYLSGSRNWKNVNELRITKINEVFNLHQNCQDDSYYQCLAKRVATLNFKRATDIVVNGSNCSFDKLCAPFSLPFDEAEKLPICTNEIDNRCFGLIIDQKLEPNQATHCKKSCLVKEFSIKVDPLLEELPKGNKNKNDQELVIEVTYDTTPKSFRELRSLEPFKTVKTEYYLLPGLSLVGNVGGTLGMFIGFSFIGSAEWFMGSAAALWQWLKRKDVVHLQRSITISQKSFWTLLCLCFLGGSISFVWPTIKEYHGGATSYIEGYEPVSLEDIPTVVTCFSFEDFEEYRFMTFTFPPNMSLFPMTYGKDVVIHATVFEKVNRTVALFKDKHVQTLLGLDIKLNELVLMRKPKWQCYKITTKWNGEVAADIEKFRMQLSFSFPSANKSAFAFHRSNTIYKTGNHFNSK